MSKRKDLLDKEHSEFAIKTIASWPKWKQDLAKQLFTPYPPREYKQNYSSRND